jgi:NAD(P)-dependent dehydrogenase (short-subunit alcohol dehydrogenase family)
MERMMKDDETVGSVDFLLSEKATYITGQNIVVDGGWSIW